MAKQKGHIKYVGTLGEVRHFKIKGNEGYFAGLKGGPTAEQVKTAPGFIRTEMTEVLDPAVVGLKVTVNVVLPLGVIGELVLAVFNVKSVVFELVILE